MIELATHQVIEERTGIQKQSNETVREYIERVAAKSDKDTESNDIERVSEIIDKELFSPKSLSDNEYKFFNEFITNIEISDDSAQESHDLPVDDRYEADEQNSQQTVEDSAIRLEENSVQNRTPPPSDRPIDKTSTRSTLDDYTNVTHNFLIDNNILEYIFSLFNRFSGFVFRNKYDYAFLTAIVVGGTYTYFLDLGYGLKIWDESIYANAARSMVQDGYWLVPHFYWSSGTKSVVFEAFLEKPPLIMWIQAISMYIFGINEFAVRIQSAVFTVLSGVVIYLFARDIYSQYTGVLASVVFLTTPYVFTGNNAGRRGATDMGHVFFGLLLIYLTWRLITYDEEKIFPILGVVAGLTVLTKGFAAGIYVLVLIPIVSTNYNKFINLNSMKMTGITTAIVAPWPIYAWLKHGHSFIQEIFLTQVVNRATGTSFISNSETLFGFMRYPYFSRLPIYFDPGIYFAIPAIICIVTSNLLVKKDDKQLADTLLLSWWAVFIVLFFAYTGNHGWYILPAFVPLSILAGHLLCGMAQGKHLYVAFGFIGTIAMILFSYRLAPLSPFMIQQGGNKHIPSGIFYTILLFAILIIIFLFPYFRKHTQNSWTTENYSLGSQFIPVLLILLFIVGTASPVYMETTGAHENQRKVGMAAAAQLPDTAEVAIQETVVNQNPQFVFTFYAGHPISVKNMEQLNSNNSVRYAVLEASRRGEFAKEYTIISNATGKGAGIILIEVSNSS